MLWTDPVFLGVVLLVVAAVLIGMSLLTRDESTPPTPRSERDRLDEAVLDFCERRRALEAGRPD